MDHKALIEKAIYTLLGLIGTILAKYVSDLNQNIKSLMLEQYRINTRIEYQEIHLRDLDDKNDVLYRIEKEMGNFERRITKLENAK